MWGTTAVVLGAVAIAGCGSDDGSGPGSTTSPPSGATTVPITPVATGGGLDVLARVTVKGKPYVFLVDTGAQTTTIDPKAGKAMGLRAEGAARTRKSVCTVRTQPVGISDWKLGSRALPSVVVQETRSAGSGQRVGDALFGGSLGADVLSRFGTVSIDARHRRMLIGGTPSGGRTVPVRTRSTKGATVVLLPVRIGSRATSFVLDTGAGRTIVDPRYSKPLHLQATGKPKTAKTAFCARSTQTPVLIRDLAVGPLKVASTPAISTQQDLLDGAGGKVVGLLGLDVLARFGTVTIDFDRSKLVLGGDVG